MLLAPPAISLLLLAMNALSTKFPSLAQPMASSKVMGLFYAASWCPDCTGVTPVVDEVYKANTDSLSVVYISSDKTQAQMSSYVPAGWAVVPFDQVDERTGLKREFGPTLIVIQSDSGKVLTTSGVDDVLRDKSGAVDKWLTMVE
jgi:thiol-disulfide isomerase/thioredoxin